jgi:hypothetical protein
MKPPRNTYPRLHGQWCSESQLKSMRPLAQAVLYSGAGFWQGRNLGSLPLRIEMKVSRGKLWVHIGASSVRQSLEVPSWRQIITNCSGTILMSLLMDSQLWSSEGDKYLNVHGMQIVLIWVIGNLCNRFDVFLQQGWSDLYNRILGWGVVSILAISCIVFSMGIHDLCNCLLQ